MQRFFNEILNAKSKEREMLRTNLEKRCMNQKVLISSDSSDELVNGCNKNKADIENIYNYITEGIGMNMVKNLKYFLNLRKT